MTAGTLRNSTLRSELLERKGVSIGALSWSDEPPRFGCSGNFLSAIG